MPEGEIKTMQKNRAVDLLAYLNAEKVPDKNKAAGLLMASKTYSCLMDSNTDFYFKSLQELRYLLDCELNGKLEEWKIQA